MFSTFFTGRAHEQPKESKNSTQLLTFLPLVASCIAIFVAVFVTVFVVVFVSIFVSLFVLRLLLRLFRFVLQDLSEFQEGLVKVCRALSEDIVRNGEGTQHVIKVHIQVVTTFFLTLFKEGS